MIAAQTLDRHDRAVVDQVTGGINIVKHRMVFDAARTAIETHQQSLRTALRTPDRFGVKASVIRIAIFAMTSLTHDKRRHRRVRAIVRNGVQDAQARPTMRAIGEGMAVTPRRWINNLLRAGRADRRVRSDLSMRRSAHALGDAKLIR